jgi:hypothetical protein
LLAINKLSGEITNLQVRGQVLGPMLAEIPREHVASAHAVTVCATHFACNKRMANYS